MTIPVFLNNRYMLTDEIRKGGQATVTKAFDSSRGCLVAIKRVRFGPDDERGQAGFNREVDLLQRLCHRNIVEIAEVDKDEEGNWFLVLDWIPQNLEDVILAEGPISWREFWERFGEPLLEAIAFAHKERIAHRDIKPKNILVTDDGVAKLADYGIAKLLDNGGSWAPVKGLTFRFHRTEGYSPEKYEPDQDLTRDCFAFAAVALSCLLGRTFEKDEELLVARQEVALPQPIRPIFDRCLSPEASQRPPLASLLLEQLRQASASNDETGIGALDLFVKLNDKARRALEHRLDTQELADIERFLGEELADGCGFIPKVSSEDEMGRLELVGGAWRFDVLLAGRAGELMYITQASDIGASLASEMREGMLVHPVRIRFSRPENEQRIGQRNKLLIVEARELRQRHQEDIAAKATQRVFRLWRAYLRDRADLEAKKKSALRYLRRSVGKDQVTFTTEITPSDEIIGQDRIVESAGGKVGGRIRAVSFNLVTMDVAFGDATRLPPSGDLAINTIAAERALSRQNAALNAVMFDRAVDRRLKSIILDPRSATPCVPAKDVEPTDPDFDREKLAILQKALGVQDVLAIEGPPGTGKTKLITEIVVQWLRRHPKHRILLSSQTHIALDNVLERVTELEAGLDVIRIGRADEDKISPASKKLLLEKRVEGWIAEVRTAAERDMNRWAAENGVDRSTVAVGMKVERLLQIRRRIDEMQRAIADLQEAKNDVRAELGEAAPEIDEEEANEETTQLDGEIGDMRRGLQKLRQEEESQLVDMTRMGGDAAQLAATTDARELGEWAAHLLQGSEIVRACRNRLALLEDWQLRVGRSPDFNAAMLSSAQIIAGTCVGIAGVKGMEDVAYDLCIIDEASKATPTEMLIPMARSRRWIVVGDPKQLPPFFEELGDDLLKSFDEEEVKQTLLDRFLDAEDGLPAGCRDGLHNQYRMAEPIGDLVSECFYNGKLVSPIKSHGLKLTPGISKPVMWYSTHALANFREQAVGNTFRNPAEVLAVRALLSRLQFAAKAQKKRQGPVSVAIIAGYTAQVEALSDMASQGVAEWPDLKVSSHSVDAFQGRQADVCIYSVVRSNSRKKLGFLKELPRLNVALSRGKSGLLIVGDENFCRTAQGRNPFKRVIEYIDDHETTCGVETLS